MNIKGTPAQGLFGATAGFFAGFAAVALFGTTASRFNEVMTLTPVMVGLLVAIPSLSGSLLRIPFGAWVDTSGGRKPFLLLLWLSLLGMTGLLVVVYGWYPDRLNDSLYPLLLVLGVLSGCGIATFSVGIGQVAYWFPQARQGAALGVYAGVGNLAPGFFSLLLPLVLTRWDLAGAYLAWTVFLLLGVLVYQWRGLNAPYFQLRDQGQPPDAARTQAAAWGQELFPGGGAWQSLAIAARNWRTWMLVAIYFTTFGGFIALTAWFPTYWREYFALGALAAGGRTALFALTASALRVPGGTLADRLGGERTALLALALMLLGALVLTFSAAVGVSVAGMLLLGVGMGVANAAVFKLMPQYVREAVGGAAGWVGGLGAFGGFVIPPLLGEFVRAQGPIGYARGFGIFVGLTLVSLGMAYWLRRARQQQVAAAASA
jgi:NNP family nitrate/nitrite transporter-like MFS transporter